MKVHIDKHLEQLSVFLSLILRHKPEAAHVTIDNSGWVAIIDLLEGCHKVGRSLTKEDLDVIVRSDDKGRYSYSEDGLRIRANQGHSLKHVDVSLKLCTPPSVLYHGTTEKAFESIQHQGLLKMSRLYVHLSFDRLTAEQVGSRRKSPLVILSVDAAQMHKDGLLFYKSVNGVWLTDYVAPQYITK